MNRVLAVIFALVAVSVSQVASASGDLAKIDVYRLDGSRFLKLSFSSDATIYLPAIGMDPDVTPDNAVCHQQLKKFTEVLEIRKDLAVSDEVKAKLGEIAKLVNQCHKLKTGKSAKPNSSSQKVRLKTSKPDPDADKHGDQSTIGIELDLPGSKKKKSGATGSEATP